MWTQLKQAVTDLALWRCELAYEPKARSGKTLAIGFDNTLAYYKPLERKTIMAVQSGQAVLQLVSSEYVHPNLVRATVTAMGNTFELMFRPYTDGIEIINVAGRVKKLNYKGKEVNPQVIMKESLKIEEAYSILGFHLEVTKPASFRNFITELFKRMNDV